MRRWRFYMGAEYVGSERAEVAEAYRLIPKRYNDLMTLIIVAGQAASA